jgi:hypothetical protein
MFKCVRLFREVNFSNSILRIFFCYFNTNAIHLCSFYMFHVSYNNQMHIFKKANICTKVYACNFITQ